MRDHVKEYMDREDTLEQFSFLDFFVNTYDAPKADENEQVPL